MALQWALVDGTHPGAPSAAVDVSGGPAGAYELTTVADDAATFHRATETDRIEGLEPSRHYQHRGIAFRTLARPAGRLLSRVATVNDVHFGEVVAGQVDDSGLGPLVRPAPGEAPYPETMNEAAADEIAAIDPVAVFVKGDLTSAAAPSEFAAFAACYHSRFGDRLYAIRGNHDAVEPDGPYSGDRWVELDGLNVAMLDTAVPGLPSGTLHAAQLDWLDELAATSTSPMIVMGHHPQWVRGGARDRVSFGLDPDASDALTDVIGRRTAIVAYAAGHTHRNRVRRLPNGVPTIEVACVKDYPGSWAEYRVYEGGINQIVHRISDAASLDWSNRCRHLYAEFGVDYETYAMGPLDQRCFTIDVR